MGETERVSRVAIAGLVLAVTGPVGLVVSMLALGKLVSGEWRCRGERVALAGMVASVLAMTGMVVLLFG